MVEYYISNQSIGYVVMLCTSGEDFIDGCFSTASIRNFGDRQSDAIEFRNDLRKGLIPESRIKQFIKSYTEQPYRYLGNGNLRKLRMVEQKLPFED
jgi:hypothetical protein